MWVISMKARRPWRWFVRTSWIVYVVFRMQIASVWDVGIYRVIRLGHLWTRDLCGRLQPLQRCVRVEESRFSRCSERAFIKIPRCTLPVRSIFTVIHPQHVIKVSCLSFFFVWFHLILEWTKQGETVELTRALYKRPLMRVRTLARR